MCACVCVCVCVCVHSGRAVLGEESNSHETNTSEQTTNQQQTPTQVTEKLQHLDRKTPQRPVLE